MAFIQAWTNGYLVIYLVTKIIFFSILVTWCFLDFSGWSFHLRTSLFNLNPRHSPVQTMTNPSTMMNTASASEFVYQFDFKAHVRDAI